MSLSEARLVPSTRVTQPDRVLGQRSGSLDKFRKRRVGFGALPPQFTQVVHPAETNVSPRQESFQRLLSGLLAVEETSFEIRRRDA